MVEDSQDGYVRFLWIGYDGDFAVAINDPYLRKETSVSLYDVSEILQKFRLNFTRLMEKAYR